MREAKERKPWILSKIRSGRGANRARVAPVAVRLAGSIAQEHGGMAGLTQIGRMQ